MSLFEKKITPIYTCIETENYRQAIKLCQHPDIAGLPLVLALRAFSMARLHEFADALTLATQVMGAHTQTTLEPGVLDTLAHTFKICNAEAQLCACYETMNAYTQSQTNTLNVDYASNLFYCYVRMREFKKAQLTAQKLYKHTNASKYVYWSVCTLCLQEGVPAQMWAVSEKMLHKVLFEQQASANGAGNSSTAAGAGAGAPTQPGAEELELYIEVLKRANKHTEALSALDALTTAPVGKGSGSGNDKRVLNDNSTFTENPDWVRAHALRVSDLKIDLLQSLLLSSSASNSSSGEAPAQAAAAAAVGIDTLGISGQLLDVCLQQLKLYPDQWSAHSIVIDLALNHPHALLSGTQHPPATTDPSAAVSEAVTVHRQYLATCQQACTGLLRGPYLAEIVLLLKYAGVMQSNDGVIPLGTDAATASPVTMAADLVRLFLNFIKLFQTKQCLFSDIKPLLDRVSQCIYLTCRADADADANANAAVDSAATGGTEGNSEQLHVLQHIVAFCNAQSRDRVAEIEQLIGVKVTASTTATAIAAAGGAGAGEGEADDEEADLADEMEVLTTNPQGGAGAGAGGHSHSNKSKSKKNKKSKGKSGGGGGGGGNKKPHSGDGKASASSTSSTAAPKFEHREKLVELVCSLCKVEQIRLHCEILLSSAAASPSSLSLCDMTEEQLSVEAQRVALYKHAHVYLSGGGVGGDKEVQPNDELLMLCSSARRLQSQETSPNSVSVVRLLQWTTLCECANVMSPHNYQPRIDLIECYRRLGAGKAAWDVFQLLGVRYIQNDSMSYVIIPALLETGQTQEALKHLQKGVCGYVAGAIRDTAEAVSKCFPHANYCKALEAQDFLNRCKSSLQLAMAKTEIPFLELIENMHSYDSVSEYLTKYYGGSLTESLTPSEQQSFIATAASSASGALTSLSANFDWTLVIRCEYTCAQEETHIQARLAQMRYRVQWNARLLALLRRLVVSAGNRSAGNQELQEAESSVIQELFFADTNGAGADSDQHMIPADPVDPVSQQLQSGGQGRSRVGFDQVLRAVLGHIFRIANTAKNSSASESAVLTQELQEHAMHLCSGLMQLREYVLHPIEGAAITKHILLSSDGNNDASDNTSTGKKRLPPHQQQLLEPQHIHRLSAFVRSVCAVGVCVLQGLCAQAQSMDSSRKDVVVQCVKDVACVFTQLLDELVTDLSAHQLDKDGRTAIKASLAAFVTRHAEGHPGVCQLQSHLESVCAHVVNSQDQSIARLKEVLKTKATELKKAVRALG